MIEIKDQEEEKETKQKTAPDIKNVELKKNVQYKATGKVGDICHYHKQEDEEKTWEEACRLVEYIVKDPKGFRINDSRYQGKVIVSQCMADQLAYMDAMRLQYEAGVFRGKINSRPIGSF